MVQSNHPDLLGAADRAGKVVREQVSAMTEAAQGTASEIDGRAREAGEVTRREALASATRVAEEIGRLEGELGQLRKFVGGEADGLRAKLDRSRLLHASRMRAEGSPELSGPAPVAEMSALSPAPDTDDEDVPEPAQAEDQDSGETPDEQPNDQPQQSPEPASDQSEAQPPDLEKTRAEIVQASDLELAELYVLASARADGPLDNEADAAYWPAVVRATVEEAMTRPDFGQVKPDDPPTGRKAKKQRARTLKPLVTALQEAVGGGASGSPPPATEESADAPVETAPPPEDADESADEAGATDEADAESGETETSTTSVSDAADRAENSGLGGRRRSYLSKAGRRRNRPFLDVAGQCAVCGRSFRAEDESALADSGWLVNGQVGLCPDDQKLGWELPEGRPVPYKRGGD